MAGLHGFDITTATTDGNMNLAIGIHVTLLQLRDAGKNLLLESSLPPYQDAETLDMLFCDLKSSRHQPTYFRKGSLCGIRYLQLTDSGPSK